MTSTCNLARRSRPHSTSGLALKIQGTLISTSVKVSCYSGAVKNKNDVGRTVGSTVRNKATKATLMNAGQLAAAHMPERGWRDADGRAWAVDWFVLPNSPETFGIAFECTGALPHGTAEAMLERWSAMRQVEDAHLWASGRGLLLVNRVIGGQVLSAELTAGFANRIANDTSEIFYECAPKGASITFAPLATIKYSTNYDQGIEALAKVGNDPSLDPEGRTPDVVSREDAVAQALLTLGVANEVLKQAQLQVDNDVSQARRSGATWAEIGATLGISQQAANQRWAKIFQTREALS